MGPLETGHVQTKSLFPGDHVPNLGLVFTADKGQVLTIGQESDPLRRPGVSARHVNASRFLQLPVTQTGVLFSPGKQLAVRTETEGGPLMVSQPGPVCEYWGANAPRSPLLTFPGPDFPQF